MNRTYLGFGFGAIQSGLFLYEAFRSGNFARLVVAEVVPEVVDDVRTAGGYWLNIATPHGIEKQFISGVEIYNPAVPADAGKLIQAAAEAHEIGTALPSVDFFSRGTPSIAGILRAGFELKLQDKTLPDAVVYTAENNNHAAGILEQQIGLSLKNRVQLLNTVVGKMSGVVTAAEQIQNGGLMRVTPSAARAFLVEEFNRILITKITLPEFRRGITVFEEKADLLPFEEAKLYGHNAVHFWIGLHMRRAGAQFMHDISGNEKIFISARRAFIEESGAALCRKYSDTDALFTPAGFAAYADDLLIRMVNPFLTDRVDRVCRDMERKLGWNDRVIGTIRLVLNQGISPVLFAEGAALAAVEFFGKDAGRIRAGFETLWGVWNVETETVWNEILFPLKKLPK
ncbi:MAG: hypothetical protein WC959_03110 [Kiritimatiellales bacterium]